MARPQSTKVVVYDRNGTKWIRFTLPPDLAASFKPPPGLPLKLDAHNRVRFSLEISSKRQADELANTIQSQLDLARRRALNFKAFALLTGDHGRVARTVAEFLDEIRQREVKRVAVWRGCSNPIDARNQHALHPKTAKRYALHRTYLVEFLADAHPGESVLVGNFGFDTDSRPHLAAFKEWLLNDRRLARATYKQLRGYFSEAWQALAVPKHYADANPWRDPQLRPPRAADTPRSILSIEQRQQIARLPSTTANNGLRLLLLTGHRVSELCWLTRGDLDREHQAIRWLNSKTGRYETLPSTAAELQILDAQAAAHSSLWFFPRKDATQCTEHYLETLLGRAMTRALKACPLPKVSPQSLRRTWQTVAARLARSDPHAIKDLMMHKTLDQQLTYIQVDTEALRETAEIVQQRIVNG